MIAKRSPSDTGTQMTNGGRTRFDMFANERLCALTCRRDTASKPKAQGLWALGFGLGVTAAALKSLPSSRSYRTSARRTDAGPDVPFAENRSACRQRRAPLPWVSL